jgi:cobalamin biosynthesis protein CbiG
MRIGYRVVSGVARPAFRTMDCTTTLVRTKTAAAAMASASKIVMFIMSSGSVARLIASLVIRKRKITAVTRSLG